MFTNRLRLNFRNVNNALMEIYLLMQIPDVSISI